jgi:hypothetical protein
MTNEQKLDLLKGMLKAATLLKKCATMLDAETNTTHKLFEGNCPTSVSYTWALENMLETIDKEIADASGIYGDNTTPNYSIPTDVFVVGREYNAWLDYFYGEHSSYLTLIGRKGDVLYLKYKNDIIRATVEIQKRDEKDVELAYIEWQGKDGNYYKTDIAADDYDEPEPENKIQIKEFYLRHMGEI